MQKLSTYFSFVKIGHTIFSLPFALIGFAMGIEHNNAFSIQKLLLILGCVLFARNAAMGFNRYADRHFDARNDRTRGRELPAQKIKPLSALFFILLNVIVFSFCTWFINPLCFYLSPVALAVILGYSLAKRVTFLCHFILGAGLGLAPIGAYIAVTNQFSMEPILLSMAVLFWVAGFDIIYALQDEAFDKAEQLHSIPAQIGIVNAIAVSRVSHFLTAVILVVVGILFKHHWLYFIGTLLFIVALISQHRLVKPNDLSKINLAFFTMNGIASVVFGTIVLIELFLY